MEINVRIEEGLPFPRKGLRVPLNRLAVALPLGAGLSAGSHSISACSGGSCVPLAAPPRSRPTPGPKWRRIRRANGPDERWSEVSSHGFHVERPETPTAAAEVWSWFIDVATTEDPVMSP